MTQPEPVGRRAVVVPGSGDERQGVMGMAARDAVRQVRSLDGLSDSPLGVVLNGALAGFAGTLVLSLALKGAQWVASRGSEEGPQQPGAPGEHADISAGEALTGGHVQAPFLDQSTEIFAQKVATGLFGASLSGGTRRATGVATHFLYGSVWGAVYGLIQASFRLPPALHGLLYGLLVWVIGPVTLVPAMGIMPPPQRQGARRALLVAGFHVAYGLGLGLTFDAFERARRR